MQDFILVLSNLLSELLCPTLTLLHHSLNIVQEVFIHGNAVKLILKELLFQRLQQILVFLGSILLILQLANLSLQLGNISIIAANLLLEHNGSLNASQSVVIHFHIVFILGRIVLNVYDIVIQRLIIHIDSLLILAHESLTLGIKRPYLDNTALVSPCTLGIDKVVVSSRETVEIVFCKDSHSLVEILLHVIGSSSILGSREKVAYLTSAQSVTPSDVEHLSYKVRYRLNRSLVIVLLIQYRSSDIAKLLVHILQVNG